MLMPGTIWSMKRFTISLALAASTLLGTMALPLVSQPVYACDSVTLSSPFSSSQSSVSSQGSNGCNGLIFNYLTMIIQFLSGAIGLVIVLMLVIGGIQYITSAGDPGAVKNAKSRITNAIIALVLFILMFAILNFLIPGGIFS